MFSKLQNFAGDFICCLHIKVIHISTFSICTIVNLRVNSLVKLLKFIRTFTKNYGTLEFWLILKHSVVKGLAEILTLTAIFAIVSKMNLGQVCADI